MNVIKLISGIDFNSYKTAYLDQADGDNYLPLLPVGYASFIDAKNSSIVNPCSGIIFGDALKVCITPGILEKLRIIDPVNLSPIQVVLAGGKLYVNPLFGFRTTALVKDTVIIGNLGPDKKIVKNFVEVMGKNIIDHPHRDSIGIARTKAVTKKRKECELYQNHVYDLSFYLRVLKKTPLGIYL